MSRRLTFFRRFTTASIAVLVLGGSATQSGIRAQEPAATRVRYDFAPVGFIQGQTIRVSVASLNPPPNPENPPPVPDRVRIFLLDAAGERVADSGPMLFPAGPSRMFDVERASVDRAGEDRTGRLQVRVVVVVSNPSGYPPGPSVPGVEVIATRTGRTAFALYPPGPTRF
jgi:hypothetical protein